jgi:hypothetical protein
MEARIHWAENRLGSHHGRYKRPGEDEEIKYAKPGLRIPSANQTVSNARKQP